MPEIYYMKNEINPLKGVGLNFITNEESSNLQDHFFILFLMTERLRVKMSKNEVDAKLTTMTGRLYKLHKFTDFFPLTQVRPKEIIHACSESLSATVVIFYLLLFSHKAN
jgi:hypothetical protein